MFDLYNNMLIRPRRLRLNNAIRSIVRDVILRPDDFIQPFFVIEGDNQKQIIDSLPNNYRYSIDLLIHEVQKYYDLGMRAIALFPVIDKSLKDLTGSYALVQDNLICRAIKAVKQAVPNILIISDIALDPYTIHGHDGVIDDNFIMDNDVTVEILTKQALNQALAGSDIIAPSDMCDGRVLSIRKSLDANNLHNIMIMSYAAKYASNLYGPFRDAVDTKNMLKQGDKKNYQMDFANKNEYYKEVMLDIKQGTDMVIVKPASIYLDIIARLYDKISTYNVPILAYHVSGEYAMLYNGINSGLFNKNAIIYENMIAIKRSGASSIITYFAGYILENWQEFNLLQD